MIKNNIQKYGLLSKLLHWLIASVMLFLIWLGWYMTGLSYYNPLYHQSIDLHKALGLTVFILFCIKVTWFMISPLPKLDNNLRRWEHAAALLVHSMLWGMIILLPITGYIISISAGASISFFGLLDVPAMVNISEYLRDSAIGFHYYLAYGGTAFVGIHIVAAFKHHFINKDNTLRRMI